MERDRLAPAGAPEVPPPGDAAADPTAPLPRRRPRDQDDPAAPPLPRRPLDQHGTATTPPLPRQPPHEQDETATTPPPRQPSQGQDETATAPPVPRRRPFERRRTTAPSLYRSGPLGQAPIAGPAPSARRPLDEDRPAGSPRLPRRRPLAEDDIESPEVPGRRPRIQDAAARAAALPGPLPATQDDAAATPPLPRRRARTHDGAAGSPAAPGLAHDGTAGSPAVQGLAQDNAAGSPAAPGLAQDGAAGSPALPGLADGGTADPGRRPLLEDDDDDEPPLVPPGGPMVWDAPAENGAPAVVVAPMAPVRRRRSRTGRALRAVLVLTVLFAVAGVAGIALVNRQVMNNVERIPNVFGPLEEAERPQKPAGTDKALNVLLVGLDTGVGEESARSDAIMLVHIAADRRSASLVSIPRNSWVAVPDRGSETISSAYAAGGPSLLVRTVEQLTALRVDHFAVVDFAGFKDITDAVGGVDVRVERSGAFPAGLNHLDGDAALRYVRQRERLPRGDLDRVRQQQQVMKALMTKVSEVGLETNPVRTLDLLDSVSRAMSVDDSLSSGKLRSLALSLRNLRPGQVAFLTAPVGSVDRAGRDTVVRLDPGRSAELWTAVARDRVPDYVRGHPELGPVPG